MFLFASRLRARYVLRLNGEISPSKIFLRMKETVSTDKNVKTILPVANNIFFACFFIFFKR